MFGLGAYLHQLPDTWATRLYEPLVTRRRLWQDSSDSPVRCREVTLSAVRKRFEFKW